MSVNELPKTAVAEHLAQKIYALDASRLPQAVRRKCEDLLVDVVGLAVTARNEDYVRSRARGLRGRWAVHRDRARAHADCRGRGFRQRHRDSRRGFRRHLRGRPGACRRGHRAGRAGGLRAAQARRSRGAHRHRRWRRDHVPALAPWRRRSPTRPAFIRRRCSAPWAPRPASARRSSSTRANWSMRSAPRPRWRAGIIEYLAEGAWTKRLHAGWAAQSGLTGGVVRPRRFFRAAHGVRRRARFLPRLRAHDQGRLRRADRRLRTKTG